MYRLLKFLPKNHLSAVVGRAVHAKLPRFFTGAAILWFARHYGVTIAEASHELKEYRTLGEFFTRDLRPGTRPIGAGIVSPVDGTIGEFGAIEADRLMQIKGKSYSLTELVRDESVAARFMNGFFINIYLAPGDYHHIHSPVDGEVISAYHIRGKLWPVNSWSVRHIDDLFATNERIVSVVESEFGLVGVVKVGATNVGSITLEYDTLQANRRNSLKKRGISVDSRSYNPGKPFKRGERIATFRMGLHSYTAIRAGEIRTGQRLSKRKDPLGYCSQSTCSRMTQDLPNEDRTVGPIRVGTRKSQLALTQTGLVTDALRQLNPVAVDVVPIVTSGDRKQGTSAAASGDKKDWILEIEQALVKEEIDFAIHSGKDVPLDIHPDTTIVPILPRATPFDILIVREFLIEQDDLLSFLTVDTVIGTASLRRRAQLLRLEPDLRIVPLRGNVTTRLDRLRNDLGIDGIVIAGAGIERLGERNLQGLRQFAFSASQLLPAVNQGILTAQFKTSRHEIGALLKPLQHRSTTTQFVAERACLKVLNADCNSAVGIFAEESAGLLTITGEILAHDAKTIIRAEMSGPAEGSEALGANLGKKLLDQGGDKLL